MYALLLPVVAVAAMAMSASAAQAAPKWFVCTKQAAETGKFTDSECQKGPKGFWEWIKVGPKPGIQVVTFGKLTLTIPGVATITCKVIDAGNIWNDEVGGKDEITAFTNYECKSEACKEPEIIAKGLPWATELLAGPIDRISGIKIAVFCSKAEFGMFEGKLEPKLENPTEAHPLQAAFTATTGELEEPVKKIKAKVEGKDSIITEEDQQIKVE